ncbi:hypothetical protein FDI59_gp032 [Mycobacterium phage Yoshi]|uniref:Uncharacterized protein n=1 Tax=Mycobacterium phage Yoshi TaxID=2920891 RepID=G1BSD9_9CAUD|nr:hypothetical protein FDI59_gp032 [Mycobacterium phage Yoshi]AEK07783.1 hypothetical protein YOSHI_32 [Mycobacterium phage Yoshi]
MRIRTAICVGVLTGYGLFLAAAFMFMMGWGFDEFEDHLHHLIGED